MKILVTGAAGFIGFHTALQLLRRGDSVIGFDSLNDYYDPALKHARLELLRQQPGFGFIQANLADRAAVDACFQQHRFDRVIHLAAQAGVRYSLVNPLSYVESNLTGFTHVLEACRQAQVPHLTYASTSSVYGATTALPFSEHQAAVHPLQFYAATKRANELMAHAYSHLFRLPTTGLRFFTVYGPWGRPDMALFLFTKNILEGKPISVFNNGHHTRDFTYIDDIVEGVIRSTDDIAQPNPEWDGAHPDPASSLAPWRLFNIGSGRQVKLGDYIAAIESAVGKKAIVDPTPYQDGDLPDTQADTRLLEGRVAYRAKTPVAVGVGHFVRWYREYHKL